MPFRKDLYKFCPLCGGRLEHRVIQPKEPARLVCRECSFVFYLEEAVVREVREEVYLEVRIDRLLNVYSYPGRTTVIAAYVAHVLSGRPGPGDETLEAHVFGLDEIPWDEIAFASTRDALRDYLKSA